MMRTRSRWLAALAVAVGTTLAVALPAAASTATINDDAHVLNVTTVQNEAATLPVPIYVWTTTQDASDKSAFDQLVQDKVSARTPISLGINTQAHHEALRIGESAGLGQDAANSAASSANSAFDDVMASRGDYTGAVQAALTSLKSSFSGVRGSEQPPGHFGGFGALGWVVTAIIVVVVFGLLGRIFRGARRFRGGFGRRYGRGYGGGYGPGYGPPPGPGYGPGYGYDGYGPGYGRGGGGVGAVGGALGGGFLGYELGKMAGENEQFRQDEMGGGFGDGGGDGGGVTGQDSDFGGGGDFGGGDAGGGGDW
ncbi:MAG TPA: hypothetical protein VHV49_02975 [Pseudonocardiaceae bacterium]|jgi:hypothetical protein|nr:hypothetical protein [Pseudonocardiaceae bacterium]